MVNTGPLESLEFKVGDTLRLKSGSPPLVVTAVDVQHGAVKVEWLNRRGDVQGHIFPAVCLYKENS